ncbi:MAG: FKBP-type peptidyl-prolyl cis-trans isomerase N-terminal domain-containing protein [Xanthomonadaceae bacterium]|nr:FKBP-type peptidyl-prolyl cis-trans isomerase N-terminal domain-containing protein [Xanthomonadaceae bacterium]
MKLRVLAVMLMMSLAPVALAQDTTSEKGKLSYAVGYEIGRDLNQRKLEVDIATVVRAIQEGYAQSTPAVSPEEMGAALQKMQEKAVAEARAEFERVSNENKARSDRFLADNRSKSGVQVLPSGIQYRVIETGNGSQPGANSEVQIHFRGSLASGQEFASTYAAQGGQEPTPMSLVVKDSPIAGLQEVLPMMKAGSRWEIFLPPEKAYGNTPRSPIGPNQAVIFDVRLVSVK